MAAHLAGGPYDLTRALNGSVVLTRHGSVPLGEPIDVTTRCVEVDDNGRRVVFVVEGTLGTPSAPAALGIDARFVLPLRRADGSRPRPSVPASAREIARWDLTPATGWGFAVLTGDLNPIHWLGPAGRAAGLGGTILHGYGTLARAIEAVIASELSGDPAVVSGLEARWATPVRLPSTLGVFVDGAGGVFAGEALGSPAALVASIETTRR